MNIEDFKNSIGGGVRPALFRVGGRIGSRTNNNLSFLVTAASLPASEIRSAAPYRAEL